MLCVYLCYLFAESAAKPEDRCAIPGCWKAKFVDAGVTHPFCSKSHRKKAEAMGSKREYIKIFLIGSLSVTLFCSCD